MSWWLTVELLIAAVIVVIACRKRQYWLGGALVFLLWPVFGWLREPSPVGAFIFGVLFIVSLLWMLSSWEIYDLAGGRLTAWFLSRGIGSRPKKRKSAQMLSHSPNGISLGSVLTQVGK